MDRHVGERRPPMPLEGSLDRSDFSVEGCLLGAEALAPLSEGRSGTFRSRVTIHPKPADVRNDPSVHAWQVILGDPGFSQSVGPRGRGELFSMCLAGGAILD